jgi:UDPglucose 6-dehydrogenase
MTILETDKKIGVIGLGAVGSAFKHVSEYFYKDVEGYDIKGKYDWSKILKCDIVFICVPTSEGADGRLDCTQVDSTLENLLKDGYTGIVAIKSTIRVGFMDQVTQRYPHLRLVYCPEFMREKSRLQWTANPDRIVLAGDDDDIEAVKNILSWAEDARIIVTDYRSAEIGKLAHNAFIATKVSFTNEIEAICSELGGNSSDVMDVITSDRRVVSKDHLKPHLGPYGGKCVPKDTRELINASSSAILLKAVEEVNKKSFKNAKCSREQGT